MIMKLLDLLKGGSVTMYLWIATGLLIASLSFGVKHYYNAYHEEVSANAVLSSKNSELIDKIKADSAAVSKLAVDSQAREEKAKAAIAEAQKKSKFWQGKANDILIAKPISPDVCISADSLFNDFIKGAKK